MLKVILKNSPMISKRPFILYTLPKSRTTQTLRNKKKVEEIWPSIKLFLATFTTTNELRPCGISLTAYEAYKTDKDPAGANKIIASTKAIFGEGETNPIAVDYPNATQWRIESRDLIKAVEYIQIGQPWPKYSFGPIELLISYDFKLIDPETKLELPNQEYKSSIMIWLSRRSFCSADLYFPFIEVGNDFAEYLIKIKSYLPFILEHKYLRRGRPNKLGTANIYSKISLAAS
jgi:hypothetical protein